MLQNLIIPLYSPLRKRLFLSAFSPSSYSPVLKNHSYKSSLFFHHLQISLKYRALSEFSVQLCYTSQQQHLSLKMYHSIRQLSFFHPLKWYCRSAPWKIPTQNILMVVASGEQDLQWRESSFLFYIFYITWFFFVLNIWSLFKIKFL